MPVPRNSLEQTLRQFYDFMDSWLVEYQSGGPLNTKSSPQYEHTQVVSGVTIMVRSWHSDQTKQAWVQFGVSGTASDQISVSFPSLPYSPDFGPMAQQSIFISATEYTPGNQISGNNIVGAMVINQDGEITIDINDGAALTTGSSGMQFLALK